MVNKNKIESKLVKWCPVDGIPKRIHLEGLYDNFEGLKLILQNEESTLEVFHMKFEGVLAYRNSNESYRLKTINQFKNVWGNWSLFEILNGDFLSWIDSESLNTIDKQNIYHYLIVTPDEILEIITYEPPFINFKKE